MKKQERGITLIALVITIIILLILAGISIAMLTGENGILTKADNAKKETDIQETKEQIKLEIMGNVDDSRNYTNEDVIRAVKKVTGNEVEEKAEWVLSEKGNNVNLVDLWKTAKVTITFFKMHMSELEQTFEVDEGTKWSNFALSKRLDVCEWCPSLGYNKENRNLVIFNGETANFFYFAYVIDSEGHYVSWDDYMTSGSYTYSVDGGDFANDTFDPYGDHNKIRFE